MARFRWGSCRVKAQRDVGTSPSKESYSDGGDGDGVLEHQSQGRSVVWLTVPHTDQSVLLEPQVTLSWDFMNRFSISIHVVNPEDKHVTAEFVRQYTDFFATGDFLFFS